MRLPIAAIVLATAFSALVGPAGATPSSTRLAGADRYATAVAVSQRLSPTGSPTTVYVATGANFPDALAAGGAAGRSAAASPILLVSTTSVPEVTAAELARFHPGRIVVLGGSSAISSAVEQRLRSFGPVSRVGGSDRFDTAALLATSAFGTSADHAYIATGMSFGDAVLAGSVAGRAPGPVLLVGPTTLPDSTARALDALSPSHVTVIGGPAAVSDGVLAAIAQHTRGGASPDRLSGGDIYETSAIVSERHNAGPTSVAFLATGLDFPDALAVGSLAATSGAPLLLSETGCIPPAVEAELARIGATTLVLVGGPAALGPAVERGAACGAQTSADAPVRTFGVSVPGAPTNLAALDAFEGQVGRRVTTLEYFQDFASAPNFDSAAATSIQQRGAMPMLAWQPNDGRGPVSEQPAYSLARLIAGDHDALIARWAAGIRDWSHPFGLRFAPEMNGNWTPWSEGVNGNTAGQYVQAWRHVHDIFASAGADNVVWVWNPMASFEGSTPLAGLYPGDAYVDVIGLDGYNWGTSQSWSRWQSATEVFGPTVTEVRAFSRKPITLCEVASSEMGGNKAAWIAEFFTFLRATPDITAFHWFNFNKESDWRVESSPSSLAAFKAGLDGWL